MFSHMDTRLVCLFSMPMLTHGLRRAQQQHLTPEPKRPDNITAQKYKLLKNTCIRHKLTIAQDGKYFIIFDFASQRLLKGFIVPESRNWCWFYGAKTVRFAEDKDAEIYLETYFTAPAKK